MRLMLAKWDKADVARYDDSITIRLPLRLIDKTDKWASTSASQAMNSIGLYIWISGNTTMIEPKAMGVHSADLHQVKAIASELAKLMRKYPLFSLFQKDVNLFDTLAQVAQALRITESVCYQGVAQPETYEPVAIHLRRVAEAAEAMLDEVTNLRRSMK